MQKYDSFWQWGNTRKKLASDEISCAADGSCSVANKINIVAGGFSSKYPKEGLLKRRHCIDAVSFRRSQRVYDGNASRFGAPCRDIGLPVEISTTEVNLFKNSDLIEANSRKSPISIIQGLNVSSSDTSSSNSDAISCHPHGDLSTRLQCSAEILVQDGFLCERKKPSKQRVWRRGQKSGPKHNCFFFDERIHDTYTDYETNTSMEASSSCSISKAESKDIQLQSWGIEARNLIAVGGNSGSEPTSSYTDLSCQRPKIRQSLISKSCFEIHNEKSEPRFEALHMLADIAVRGLVPGCKEEDSSEQWVTKEIFQPSGVFFWQKRVIRRAKSAFKSVQKMQGNEEKLVVTDSDPPLTSNTNAIGKFGSPGCMKTNDNQFVDVGVADKEQVAVQSIRSSKRTRSQFLNTKYCDSVLQPLKKGTRR